MQYWRLLHGEKYVLHHVTTGGIFTVLEWLLLVTNPFPSWSSSSKSLQTNAFSFQVGPPRCRFSNLAPPLTLEVLLCSQQIWTTVWTVRKLFHSLKYFLCQMIHKMFKNQFVNLFPTVFIPFPHLCTRLNNCLQAKLTRRQPRFFYPTLSIECDFEFRLPGCVECCMNTRRRRLVMWTQVSEVARQVRWLQAGTQASGQWHASKSTETKLASLMKTVTTSWLKKRISFNNVFIEARDNELKWKDFVCRF